MASPEGNCGTLPARVESPSATYYQDELCPGVLNRREFVVQTKCVKACKVSAHSKCCVFVKQITTPPHKSLHKCAEIFSPPAFECNFPAPSTPENIPGKRCSSILLIPASQSTHPQTHLGLSLNDPEPL